MSKKQSIHLKTNWRISADLQALSTQPNQGTARCPRRPCTFVQVSSAYLVTIPCVQIHRQHNSACECPQLCTDCFERAGSPKSRAYLRGTNLEEAVAPIPGLPCLMGL